MGRETVTEYSKITKTRGLLGLIDGYLATAQEGTVTIPALISSASAAEWTDFQANYGTGGSLIQALNDAWDNGGGGGGGWDGKYEVAVVTSATYVIDDDAFNTAFLFVNPTPGADVEVTLPSAATMGEGAVIDVTAIGVFIGEAYYGMFVLLPSGSDTIMWPGGDSSAVNLGTQQSLSKIRLISNGVNGWGVLDAMGCWGEAAFAEGAWTFISTYRFDGHLPDGVEDNAVSIDAFGNIKDSGFPVGISSGVYLSGVIMPIVDTPTSMDRGDEWFNLFYSTSVLSGFGINQYEPDDRQDPMPLTWKISFFEGEVCLRATPDPSSAVTIYSCAADEIFVTGPVAYVYAYVDDESVILASKSSWSRLDDRMYALLYTLTIYDHKEPEIPILESIVIGETLVPDGHPTKIWSPSTPPYTRQLVATGYYVGGSFADVTASVESWGSSDETHATVSAGGLVTFVQPGTGSTAVITASIGIIADTITADNGAW